MAALAVLAAAGLGHGLYQRQGISAALYGFNDGPLVHPQAVAHHLVTVGLGPVYGLGKVFLS
jgi:hypothetical protein